MVKAWIVEELYGSRMGKQHNQIWTVIIGGENKNLKYMNREFVLWLTYAVHLLRRYVGNKWMN
jgi:hypothetical protein